MLEPAIVRRLEKEKRGQGFGKEYKPFLSGRDVPSKGRVHRRPALTHNRIVHLLSDLELAAFLLLDWKASVIDIREQFPLNPESTIEIANRLGIRHPAYQGVYQVMTTDFLIDLDLSGKHVAHAISVKYAQDLDDERTVEKLELERRFWEGEGVDWFILTEHEVPVTLVKNIRWLVPHMHSYDLTEDIRLSVFNRMVRIIDANPEEKIPVLMRLLDDQQGVPTGTNFQYFRHFSAQQAFGWDMQKQLHTSLRAKHICVLDYWLNKDAQYVHA
jgi:hypothetical protein